MKSADDVAKQLEEWKKAGKPLMWIAWNIALLCVGWAYVFGARGELCTPANRRAYFKSKGSAHPTIASKCQVIRSDNPKDSCNGCKWYPGKKRTRFFDCRGLPYWILLQVYGWKLQGAGATSQWDNDKNWKAKGEIKTMPQDQLVCLFQRKGSKMAHTGLGFGNETVECQVGVQYFKKRSSKWTHWGLPACCAEDYVPPSEKPAAEKPKEDNVSKPTLKKGASGSSVKELQKLLIEKGYSCGSKGADGKFGDSTLAAVKAFQKAAGLKVDGIVGAATWEALQKTPETYTVTIKGLDKTSAQEICNKYKNATMKEG